MNSFTFAHVNDVDSAVAEIQRANARFIGGGTNLLDLMKQGVERPEHLVDISQLPLVSVDRRADGGLAIGALTRNSDLANHPLVRRDYPLLSEALLSGASPQLRNMATLGGNLMQRTRCYYFNDLSYSQCNKREPGSGCAARDGFNRIHAILGSSESCIAVHPSDLCVALLALDATVRVQGPRESRTIAMADFHRLPGSSPERETNLRPGELIVGVDLPASTFAQGSHYLKVRDRASYAFALVSVAAAVDLHNGDVRDTRIVLGGVAHKPWRATSAEAVLRNRPLVAERIDEAAAAAVEDARGYPHNRFKIELTRRAVRRALRRAARMA